MRDLDPNQVDLNPRKSGALIHFILQKAFSTAADLDVEQLRGSEFFARCQDWLHEAGTRFELLDERLHDTHLRRIVAQAERSIEYDNKIRRQSPGIKTVACELEVAGWISLLDGELSTVEQDLKNSVRVHGYIDRVDRLPNGAMIIIDYKSSEFGIENWPKWVDAGHLQLPFYMQALASGLTRLGEVKVAGAAFHSLKPVKRSFGLFRKSLVEANAISPDIKASCFVDDHQFVEVLEGAMALVATVVRDIQSGDFTPKPREYKICESCYWRPLCRATHLNR